MVQFRTTDGVRVQWEGAKADATTLNCWGHDYVRAECRDATLILDDRELTRQPVDDAGPSTIPLQDRELWTNAWLIEQFVEWLDGREPMATKVSANLQSMALIESAIQSADRGESVDVQAVLERTRREQGVDV